MPRLLIVAAYLELTRGDEHHAFGGWVIGDVGEVLTVPSLSLACGNCLEKGEPVGQLALLRGSRNIFSCERSLCVSFSITLKLSKLLISSVVKADPYPFCLHCGDMYDSIRI